MASDLRMKLISYIVENGAYAEDCLASARLALESLPCACDVDVAFDVLTVCDRCQRLASLASEGKGG